MSEEIIPDDAKDFFAPKPATAEQIERLKQMIDKEPQSAHELKLKSLEEAALERILTRTDAG